MENHLLSTAAKSPNLIHFTFSSNKDKSLPEAYVQARTIAIPNGSTVPNKPSARTVRDSFFGVNASKRIPKSGEKMKNVNNKSFIVNPLPYRAK